MLESSKYSDLISIKWLFEHRARKLGKNMFKTCHVVSKKQHSYLAYLIISASNIHGTCILLLEVTQHQPVMFNKITKLSKCIPYF